MHARLYQSTLAASHQNAGRQARLEAKLPTRAGTPARMISGLCAGMPSAVARQQWLLLLQRRYGNGHVQRMLAPAADAEHALTQRPANLEAAVAGARDVGQALDPLTRTRMQSAFGADLSGVRTHTGPRADTLNRDLGARAFTVGQDIFFRRGEYNVASSSGRELLAHELTHVIQQRNTVQTSLEVSDPGDASEREAAAVARVLGRWDQSSEGPVVGGSRSSASTPTRAVSRTIQRMTIQERNALDPADYTHAVYNTTTNSGFYLFTIWHYQNRNYNIQVHWHPVAPGYPQESWTVRWANEGRGNKGALNWMIQMVRATRMGLSVALSSQSTSGGTGGEYQAQFPALPGVQ